VALADRVAAVSEEEANIRRHKAMDRLDASIHALCAETGMTEDELRRMLTEDETPNDGHGTEEHDRERE
jgi:hypothetical protein